MIRLATAIATLALLALAGAGDAHAQGGDRADCTVLEIRASNDDGGIDPALRPVAKKLKRPPFSSWKSFRLLKKHSRQVVKMKALELRLVSGGRMALLYRESVPAKKNKTRLRLSLTLDDKNGKRKLDLTIKLDSGDYHLIGGDPLEGGATYVLATSCSAP